MNSCILAGKIVSTPQLRYTQDNQLAITEMMLEFDNPIPNNPPCLLKVVAWGSLAVDIEQRYHEGNEVIVQGRLRMDTIEKNGYKEKVASMTLSHIYPLLESDSSDVIGSESLSWDSSSPLSDEEEEEDDDEEIKTKNLDDIPF